MVKAKNKNWTNKKSVADIVFTVTMITLLVVFTIIFVVIFVWGMLTSFKTDWDFMFNKIGLPAEWTFENYSIVWRFMYVWINNGRDQIFIELMYLNSILYAAGGGFLLAIFPCVVAYLTVKFPCAFSKAVTDFVIVAMIIPIVGSAPSELQVLQTLGLYDHIWGLWIMKASFLGMYFLVFQGVFRGIPQSITEAAKIDGAGNMRIFLQMMLPLVRTTFLLIFLLQFIGLWNDYQTPLLYLPNNPTIAQGLYSFNFSTSNEYSTVPAKVAGAMFVLLPILIVFMIFKNKLMSSLTLGGEKE